MATIINKFGKMQGYNSITLHFLGRDVEARGEINYDDTITKENVYGAGKYPIGRGEGQYEAKCSIGLYKEEIDALQASLPPGMRIQDVAPFPIDVVYELSDGTVLKNRINNAEFKNRGVAVKQGDGSILTVFELLVSHIDWAA